MFYFLIPLILGLVSLGVFLFFRVREKRVIAVYFKALTSVFFIATGIVALFTSKNPNLIFGLFIIAGLFFGLLGDVFLDIKFITQKHEDLFTKLGFISFGFGHILFTTGLFVTFYDFSRNVFYLILPVIGAVLLVGVSLFMEKFTPIRYGKMKPFVIGYGFVLFFTVLIYLSTTIQHSWNVTTLIVMFVSLVLFALSDLILNNTYFSKGCNTPVYIISNHVVYYLAQFGIAMSLFFLI